MYTITLKKDGSVNYVGMFNVSKIGTYEAKITLEDFSRLEKTINHFRFFEMNDFYPAADDVDSAVTEVSSGQQKKVIERMSGSEAPIGQWMIEMTIDGLVSKVTDWKKIDEK